MPYNTRYRSTLSPFGRGFQNGVKWLITANVAIYVVYFFASLFHFDAVFRFLVLSPWDVVHHGEIWQLATYLFLHSPVDILHILLNMLVLWMVGTSIEATWGTRRFLQFYFICGIGAGVCVVIANFLFGNPYTIVIGASGAIYGLLLAFGMLFPDQEILIMFLFPVKAKYMVMIIGAIAFLGSFQTGGTVSNLAHLGGMIAGYIYMKTQFAGSVRRRSSGFSIQGWWKDYKLRRAKKKFQVYMRKHDSGNGPWVN